jgi:hypothetical protein
LIPGTTLRFRPSAATAVKARGRPVDIARLVGYLGVAMGDFVASIRPPKKALAVTAALLLLPVLAARAAVVAEGTYTISAPERRAIPFRMVVTPTGARITPAGGETMIFSYEKKSALILDAASRSFFLLPLELVPALLSAGLGYDPRGLGATASGTTKKVLGTSCGEVLVSGKTPRLTLRSCRVADPAWSRDYARLEGALGLPWATAEPPPVFVGLPLLGSLDIEGARPYRASWEITKLSRDESLGEDFVVPPGYRMDLERLLILQNSRR